MSYFESAGTTTTSGSSVSRAIGVVSSIRTAEALVSTAPTMTRPITISVFGSFSLASWARPTVPPAPPTLVTGAEATRSSCVSTCDSARPV